jgi:hypothetical protein
VGRAGAARLSALTRLPISIVFTLSLGSFEIGKATCGKTCLSRHWVKRDASETESRRIRFGGGSEKCSASAKTSRLATGGLVPGLDGLVNNARLLAGKRVASCSICRLVGDVVVVVELM